MAVLLDVQKRIYKFVQKSFNDFKCGNLCVLLSRVMINPIATFLGKPVTKGVSGRSALNTLPERRGLND